MKKETVQVVRGAGRDRSGKPAGAATETDRPGVIVVPTKPGEATADGQVIRAGYKLFFPRRSDVLATDQIRVRGELQHIVGRPADYGKRIYVLTDQVGAAPEKPAD